MTVLNKDFLTKIINLKQEKRDITYWDDKISGFGLRVQGNSMSWIVMYRNSFGKLKKYTIGKTNQISPTEARKKAEQIFADIKLNNADPSLVKSELKNDLSVSELCDIYLNEGVYNKKPSTIDGDRSRIRSHIIPLIGSYPIKSLNKQMIEKLILDISNGKTAKSVKSDKSRGLARICGGRATAKRVFETFSSILTFAERRGLISSNPAMGIPKPKLKAKEVFLTLDEYKELGKAINEAQKQKLNQTSINAIKLLALTGCRKNEILSLKWEYVDFENQCFRFPDTKTGKQNRAFGIAALNLLRELETNKTSDWVFPASVGDGCLVGTPKVFKKICTLHPFKEENGNYTQDMDAPQFIKKDISLHTLRHSFASTGADMGYIELTIAGLLGHKLGTVTSRYSHNVDSSLINAANRISLRIDNAIKGIEPNECNIIQFEKIV